MQHAESTARPGAVTIERDAAGTIHVVLAENIIQRDQDGTPIYEYDQTRIVTDDGKYRARTLAGWKPLATPEKYDGCVMTDNGLVPCVVMEGTERAVLTAGAAIETVRTASDISVATKR